MINGPALLRHDIIRRLPQKGPGIIPRQLPDGGFAVAASLVFDAGFGDGEGIADAPVAGGVHPEAFGAVHFDDVGGALAGAFSSATKPEGARMATSIRGAMSQLKIPPTSR